MSTPKRLAPFVAVALALLLVVVVPERGRDLDAATSAAPVTTTVSTAITTTTSALPVVVEDAVPMPVAAPAVPAVFAAPPTTTTTTGTVTAVAAVREPTPLLVAASGWASLRSGTPADAEVPDGGLPVGTAAGAEDKRSFVRLVGDETVLRLAVDAASTTSPDAGAIRACRIVDDWEPAAGMRLEEAPAHDDAACVDGVATDDGSAWSFDLAAFADRTDHRGFALLPVPSSAVATFQITLRTS